MGRVARRFDQQDLCGGRYQRTADSARSDGWRIAVPAVKQTTSVIPVVFAISRDPNGTGLVASLISLFEDPADCAMVCQRTWPIRLEI